MAGLNLGQNNFDGETIEGQVDLMNPTTPTEAAFDLSWEQTPVGALARIYSQREAEQAGGEKLPPGTLNEMFPELPEKFNEPTTMRVAQLIADRNHERQKLQRAIENGPKDLIGGTTTFAASLLPHVLDPINVAASVATGGLASYFAGVRAMGTAAKLGFSIAENFVGNMAVEPLVFAANKMDNTPYTLKDSFENAIAPAVIFPLAGLAGKRLMRAVGLLDPVTGGAVHNASIGRLAEGKDPAIGAKLMAKQLVRETSGTEFKTYSFKQFDTSAPDGRPFFSGTHSNGDASMIGEYLGDGTVYLSDNANVANGSAARLGASNPGDVVHYDLASLKLADPVNEDIKAIVENLTGEKIKASASASDVLNTLATVADDGNEQMYKDFQSRVKDLGYDGVTYKQDKFLGEDHPPHNVVAVFSPEKLSEKFREKSNPQLVPRLSQEEVQAFAEPRLKDDLRDEAFVQNTAGIEKVLSFADNITQTEQKVTQIVKEANESLDDLLELENGAYLDASELKSLEEVKRLSKRQDRFVVATAQALACIRGA